MSAPLQVLIIGAGPTGLALACLCLRLGLRTRIIDQRSGPSTTSKAIGLQYRVSEILACMGLAERFIVRGSSPTTVNIYAGRERLVALNFQGFERTSGIGAFEPRPIMIAQSETEALLGEALLERGGRTEWDTTFQSYSGHREGVEAILQRADGTVEHVSCDWLVSCEGAHSQVRKQAGLSFEGKSYPLAFLMADVELKGELDHNENHVWMHRDGSFAALPFPQAGRWRLFIEIARSADRVPADVGLAEIEALMAERTDHPSLEIVSASWVAPFSINCRIVDCYRRGRALLAGDAAHIHSPTGGQGIATGLQDAMNLAWKLARVVQGAPETLLDTYDEERRDQGQKVLAATDRTTAVLFAPHRGMRWLRDHVVLPVLRHPRVQREMFHRLSQLRVHYRGSWLSHHQDRTWWSTTRIHAGDRAPDICLRGDQLGGSTTTLFKLLQAMRPVAILHAEPSEGSRARITSAIALLRETDVEPVVVVTPGETPWINDPHALVDVHDELLHLYGMSGEFLCLVRPDDHVGLFQRPIDLRSLNRYLALISGRRADRAALPTESRRNPVPSPP